MPTLCCAIVALKSKIMTKEILPVIDTDVLQQKANEYAMKGAEEALKEFYTSYNSPYKKAIEENLKNKGLDHSFNIPDIVGVLNEKFSQEIDLIANTAVAKSFVPMVKEFLIREDAEIKFSDILKKFIEVSDFDRDEMDVNDYTVEKIEEDSKSYSSSFFQYQISNRKTGYELRFYKNSESTTIMTLPYRQEGSGRFNRGYEVKQTMKVSLDGGATLEMPFTKGILEDRFISFIARLVIGNNQIIFDVQDFDEDMFPQDECHCH